MAFGQRRALAQHDWGPVARPVQQQGILLQIGKTQQGAAALARTHGGMNEEQRHELRIAFKKLRYALEFFVPLLPRKGRSSYFASLAKIHELLGLLNDLVTAAQRIATLPRNKDMPPLICGWFAGRAHLLTQLFDEELQYFLTLPVPWRSLVGRRKDKVIRSV